MIRAVLVGEHNPVDSDPKWALFPRPTGSAGWRLCHKIFGMGERGYLRAFDRRNLMDKPRWSAAEGREAAARIMAEGHSRYVLLGAKVARAFGFDYEPHRLVATSEPRRVSYLILPHPSGRCRAWNDPTAIEGARARLLDLICPRCSGLSNHGPHRNCVLR